MPRAWGFALPWHLILGAGVPGALIRETGCNLRARTAASKVEVARSEVRREGRHSYTGGVLKRWRTEELASFRPRQYSEGTVRIALLTLAIAAAAPPPVAMQAPAFDHTYARYADLLGRVVSGDRVDYRTLKARRELLDAVAREFGAVSEVQLQRWNRAEQLAYWINAYNLFTLQAIVDHYPIQNGFFSLEPRNSIRQIDGVWTELTFTAGGRPLTLDDIEHRILRPRFDDPRIHFAINCASASCPVLDDEPYRADRLDEQLDEATRRFLGSSRGLEVDDRTLRVSKIFDWYGEDFVARFASRVPGEGRSKERAARGVVSTFGPPQAQRLARNADTRVEFLDYDWSLNDIARE